MFTEPKGSQTNVCDVNYFFLLRWIPQEAKHTDVIQANFYSSFASSRDKPAHACVKRNTAQEHFTVCVEKRNGN